MRLSGFVLLAPVVCFAQAPALPRISFETLHHDFGKISGDNKVSYRFKVTNTGKAPLNISRLNPSCGCTSTVLGKWTLAPEESTEIEVTFNPAGFRGLSRKSIQVVSDDPATPIATLTFEAEVVREIMPSTDTVFFQDLIRTAPRKASIKLVSGTERPVKVTDVKVPGVKYYSWVIRPEGKDAWIDLTLDGSKIPTGKMMGADTLFVATTNSRVPSIPITVQWELRASITADPVRVAWVEPAGKELRTKVVLKQVDNKPFRVLSAKVSGLHFRIEGLTKTAASHHEFQVVMAPDAPAGLYSEKINLTFDDPDQPDMELRVSASLR